MAVASVQVTGTNGPHVAGNDVTFDVTGGTLDNSSVCQFNWDDAVFVGQEGKQRLLAHLKIIEDRISTAKLWPITAAS
jgi:hypothetical protein